MASYTPLEYVLSDWQKTQQAAAPKTDYRQLYDKLDSQYDAWKSGLTSASDRARTQVGELLGEQGYTPDQYGNYVNQYIDNILAGVTDPGDPSTKLQYRLKDAYSALTPDQLMPKLFKEGAALPEGSLWTETGSKYYRPAYMKTYKSLDADKYAALPSTNSLFNADSLASTIANRIANKQAHAPDPVTGQTQQQSVTDYTGKVNALKQQYDPYSMFGTVDSNNDVIQNILGTGYNDASTLVNNAFKRGVLTDTGLSRAMSELSGQRAAGAQSLTQNANDIYSKNRQTISDLLGKADTSLDAFKTSNTPFNFDSISKQIGDTATNLQSGFEGSLRNSATGQQFFDASKAINLGGGAQGGVNPITRQTDSLATAIASMNKKNAQPRTLGNSGAF